MTGTRRDGLKNGVLPNEGSIEFDYQGARIKSLIRRNPEGAERYRATYDRYDLSGALKEMTLPGNVTVKRTYDAIIKACHNVIAFLDTNPRSV